jgi:hypothetical protein
VKPVQKNSGLHALRRLAVGVVAAAGSLMLVAPLAHAAPADDARGAIDKAAAAVADGSADQGFRNTGLGEKEGDITSVGDGFEQKYAGGAIYWSDKTGAQVLYGAINDKFVEEQGPTGSLGFPTKSEGVAPAPEGARYAEFAAEDHPKIYWTPQTGAWVVRGPFAAALADPQIAGALGVPVGAAEVNGDIITQKFANGTLTFDAKTGKWINLPDIGLPDLGAKLGGLKWPALSLPGWPKINLPNIGAPDVNMPDVNAPDINAPDINAPKTSGFNWWWLLLPLLIIGGLLLLAWLWRLLTGKGKGHNVSLHAPDLKAPNLDGAVGAVKGAGGKIAASAAGAAAAAGTAAAAAGGKVKDAAEDAADAAGRAGDKVKGAAEGAFDKVKDGAEDLAGKVKGGAEDLGADAKGLVGDIKDKGAAGAAGVAGAAGAAAATWTKADGTTVPLPKGSHLPLAGNAEPKGFPIKGNADSGLYHTPASRAYKATIAEIWFATEADAEAAGFKKFE